MLIVMISITFNSCKKDFLERVPEDTYIASEFYQTADQIEKGTNPLYGGVWFDYYRNLLDIGDVMAGNWNKGDKNQYYTFSIPATSNDLTTAYASLYMAASYANSVKENIEKYAPATVDPSIKNNYLGEALVMKSMAYFFLVRCFGDVPVIHDGQALINSGITNVSTLYKIKKYDVYEYIIKSLKKAADLLPPPSQSKIGRVNKWSAYGLMAKAYLTRAGIDGNGSRNQADLDSAAKYAKLVVSSNLQLWPNYREVFSISKGNYNPENLISLHWVISGMWGSQNALQADIATTNFTGTWDGWGAWNGVTIDLVSLYGDSAKIAGPLNPTNNNNRPSIDARRKGTVMLDGDFYPEFHRDKGGYPVYWDAANKNSQIPNACGSLPRKHLVGNNADHQAEAGVSQEGMKTNLATHLLRLSDVYLVLAEAKLGNNASTTDPEALAAINAVRARAGVAPFTSFTFDDIYKERRRELAFEGDNWFDYVRLSYYNPSKATEMLKKQERGAYKDGDAHNPSKIIIESKHYWPLTYADFTLPFPANEVLVNPNLGPDVPPVNMDWEKIKF